eukprot:4077781-Pyramimonas_sp.AAC.1
MKGTATGHSDPGRARGLAWTTGPGPPTGAQGTLASRFWQPRGVLRRPPVHALSLQRPLSPVAALRAGALRVGTGSSFFPPICVCSGI